MATFQQLLNVNKQDSRPKQRDPEEDRAKAKDICGIESPPTRLQQYKECDYSMALAPEASVEKLPHHEQLEFCVTRARYRQGRKLTAVRVYTVNDESKYLIVNGVPAIKISEELEILCQRYGDVEYLKLLSDYPHDDYVEVYLVKYQVLRNARFAKKQLDGKSFYGQVLHVCYAPELETLEETREKLQERRKSIAALTRHHQDPAALGRIQKGRVMPPTAVRYMNQLRPELKTEHLDELHHRVEDSQVTSSGVSHQEQSGGGGGTLDHPHPSKWCSGAIKMDETVIAKSVSDADLKNGSEKATEPSSVLQEESVDIIKRKKRSTESFMTTKKKIRLFGNKNLLSYNQD